MTDRREFPDHPIVGVGVVVFRAEEVLLIRRGKPPRKGELSLPGGAQALGETVRETAVREVREETGLEIDVTELIDVVDIVRHNHENRVQYHYTLVDFAARWRQGTPVAASDADDAFWVPVKDVPDLPLWSETVRIIMKAAEMQGIS